jgi:hypothetical protein
MWAVPKAGLRRHHCCRRAESQNWAHTTRYIADSWSAHVYRCRRQYRRREALSPEALRAVTAAHPRSDFKRRILRAFNDGNKHRPHSTFGNVCFTLEVGYGNDRCDEELVAPAAWPGDLRGRDGAKRWTSPHHNTRIAILI